MDEADLGLALTDTRGGTAYGDLLMRHTHWTRLGPVAGPASCAAGVTPTLLSAYEEASVPPTISHVPAQMGASGLGERIAVRHGSGPETASEVRELPCGETRWVP